MRGSSPSYFATSTPNSTPPLPDNLEGRFARLIARDDVIVLLAGEVDTDARRFYERHGFTNIEAGLRMLLYIRELGQQESKR